MDTQARLRLVNEMKEKHNVEISSSLFTLCENAAKTIVDNANNRKKELSTNGKSGEPLALPLKFYADFVSRSASAISNQNGSAQAGIAVPIVILMIFAFLVYWKVINDTDHYSVQSMWDSLKNFGVEK